MKRVFCKSIRLSLFSLAFFIISLALGVPAQNLSAQENPKIQLLTTTGIIADLARNIVDDSFDVKSLMGPGVDPHLYKATQSDLKKLEQAQIIFYNGLHLEGKIADILEKFSRKKPCFAVAAEINPELLRKPPEFEGNYDPHIWFSVPLWIKSGEKVRDELIKFKPEKKEIFSKNFEKYKTELDELNNWASQSLAKIPATQRILITAHDAFGYFGATYQVEVHGLQGISTATEFGLHDVSKLVNLIIEKKIKAIFVENSIPEKFMISLREGVTAKGGEVKIGGSLYSDSLGAENTPEGTYIGMFKTNVNTIANALQ